jgi:hypothetical protein
MATAPVGKDRLTPLVRIFPGGSRVWLAGGSDVVLMKQCNPVNIKTMSDRLVAATGANHQSSFTLRRLALAFGDPTTRRGIRGPQSAIRIPRLPMQQRNELGKK